MGRVVTGQSIDASAESAGLKCIQEWNKRTALFLHKNKVVTLVEKRDKIQPKLVSGGP
jgi:hypothetical protein